VSGGTGRLNLAWAGVFVDELVRAGVREVCVAPGSRSTPLVLAVAREPRLRAFVHLDERCAAFFALGVGKATGRPAAVVTTSGTAVANLAPAALEAARSGAPLLLLTADRPARLRGTDANQTVDQIGFFGPRVRMFHDVTPARLAGPDLRSLRALAGRAVAAARGRPAGPVHLNFPFEKPLQPERTGSPLDTGFPPGFREAEPLGTRGRPEGRPYARTAVGRRSLPEEELERLTERMAGARRGLLVCGVSPEPDRLGPAALALARATGWPLLADPLSGARFREGAVGRAIGSYDLFLRDGSVRRRLAPDLVLRLGGRATSAALARYLEEVEEAEQVVVQEGEEWPDPAAVATDVLRADPAATAALLAARREEGGATPAEGGADARRAWRARWEAAEAASRRVIADRPQEGEREETGLAEEVVPAAVAEALPDGATLFVGSSLPVRDLDAFAAPRDGGPTVLGNRGASGIDGSVSTALGAGAAAGGASAAVIGDLALYHDMNGLLGLRRFDLETVVVVIQNDGGGIFHQLPVREHEAEFERFFATPHGLDFRHAAELYDLPHERVTDRDRLAESVRRRVAGGEPVLLEVPSDREAARRRRERLAREVRHALASGGAPRAGREREFSDEA